MVMMMHILTMHHLLVEEKILEAVMDGLGDQDQIGERGFDSDQATL
jgi:hypothetical protein